MDFILDTNTYSDAARGETTTTIKLRKAGRVYMTFISVAELRAGFACGKKTVENEKALQKFLANSRVTVLYADSETSIYYARIYFALRKAGTPIPTNDLWIAALSFQHGIPVFSRDKHFRAIENIDTIN